MGEFAQLIMGIVDFVFNILIVLLFVRFFIDEQSFYQFGQVLTMIQQVTDPFIKPVRTALGGVMPRLQRWAPIIAMVGVILVRGALYTLLGDITGILKSLERAADTLVLFIIAMLFVATLFVRSNFYLPTNAGFRIFQEGCFNAFRISRMIWRTERPWGLFIGSVVWLLLAHFLFVTLVSLRVFDRPFVILLPELFFLMKSANSIIYWYTLELFVAIIASWLTFTGAGKDLPAVRGVRALAEPFFRIFRQWCPWAKWGFIDFSPMLAFLALYFIGYLIQLIVRDLTHTLLSV